MDRLFLDANILFSAAYTKQAGIKKFWTLPNIKLVSSSYALEEAKRNLSQVEQLKQLNTLLKQVELHNGYDETLIPSHIKLRNKDRPILAAAICSSSNYLITGDVRDFGSFYGKKILNIVILPPSEYLQCYSEYIL